MSDRLTDLPAYVPDDQRAHLGPPPWSLHDDAVQAWERAHNHDPRTKCYVEYGCQALADHYEWLLDEVERLRGAVESRKRGNIFEATT